MKKLTFIGLCILLCQFVMAQDAVTDVVTEQMEVDGEPAVVITYTLNKVGSEA